MRSAGAPSDLEKEKIFHDVMSHIYQRHAHTLITMAKAAHEMRKLLGQDLDKFAEFEEVQESLDNFFLSRIGIRTLIGQYLSLSSNDSSPDPNTVGIIHHSASPYEIAKNAIEEATYMCTRAHGDAPQVTIHGRIDLTMATIPEYIHYILLELLKNSMRATVEFHGVDNKLPPIKIIIADGENNEDVVGINHYISYYIDRIEVICVLFFENLTFSFYFFSPASLFYYYIIGDEGI
jgi:pyruvate dehydrogenase kinase 2/3/4